jgi:predicted phosphodiesterase
LISKERAIEIVEYALTHGEEATFSAFGISSETYHRYKRAYKQHFGENADLLMKLKSRYTTNELKAIAKGKQPELRQETTFDFTGEDIVFGAITDTHIGSKYFNPAYLSTAIQVCKDNNCQFITHSGDVVEGMSGRDGHIYELTEIGYKAQRAKAIELMSEWEGKWYMIAGNHSLWFNQKANMGANIVEDICAALPDAEYLGDHEGDILLNGVNIRLWHGIDGSSSTHSYRIQQVLASLDVHEIPHVLIAGHTHKNGFFYDRGCYALTAGSLQDQSGFMRYKRLPAHVGFYIIRMKIRGGQVVTFSPTFYPLGG